MVASQENNCRGRNKQKGEVQFSFQVTEPGLHYLVLDNGYSLMVTKKVNANIIAEARMPEPIRQNFRRTLDKASSAIQATFQVEEFDFRLEPCGQKNAYSAVETGDITLCTELVFDLVNRDLPGALEGIIYHELGHSLLNLWGLPGWDNEETVDEFAMVALFLKGEQEHAFDWMQFNAERNSAAEASYALENDMRHPLSIQRLRNQKRILDNPGEVISRWNKILYPRMTKEGLEYLMQTSPKYVDHELMSMHLGHVPASGVTRR